jgi:hypothetical protein
VELSEIIKRRFGCPKPFSFGVPATIKTNIKATHFAKQLAMKFAQSFIELIRLIKEIRVKIAP